MLIVETRRMLIIAQNRRHNPTRGCQDWIPQDMGAKIDKTEYGCQNIRVHLVEVGECRYRGNGSKQKRILYS